MDFSQSYYPGQFLDDTAPLLDLDPSLLPEDEFDLPGEDNVSPPAGSPDLSAGADGNALPMSGLAASYLGADAPAFSLGTGVSAMDDNAPSSSPSAAFNAPPLQLGPTLQSGPSETLPPWAEYLAPEIRQLLAAPPRPLQWEDTPVGAYTSLPAPDDWLQTTPVNTSTPADWSSAMTANASPMPALSVGVDHEGNPQDPPSAGPFDGYLEGLQLNLAPWANSGNAVPSFRVPPEAGIAAADRDPYLKDIAYLHPGYLETGLTNTFRAADQNPWQAEDLRIRQALAKGEISPEEAIELDIRNQDKNIPVYRVGPGLGFGEDKPILPRLAGAMNGIPVFTYEQPSRPPANRSEAILNAVNQVAQGLSTPKNLALALALPEADPALIQAAEGYFGLTMTHDALENAAEAYRMPAGPERDQKIAEAILGGGMGLGPLAHLNARPGGGNPFLDEAPPEAQTRGAGGVSGQGVAVPANPVEGNGETDLASGGVPAPPGAVVAGMQRLRLNAIADSLRSTLDAPEEPDQETPARAVPGQVNTTPVNPPLAPGGLVDGDQAALSPSASKPSKQESSEVQKGAGQNSVASAPPPPPFHLPASSSRTGPPAPPLSSAEWSPSGTPISNSVVLNLTNLHEAEVREALDAQALVHGDGPLRPKEVNHLVSQQPDGTPDDGSYFPGDHIGVLQGVKGAAFIFLHESAHWIDDEGIDHDQAYRYASDDQTSATKPLMDAIRGSKAVKEIQKLPQSDYRDYLLTNSECFARAYAQFIAIESHNPVLLDWLDDVRSGVSGYKSDSQWSPADFAPISREFHALFKNLGWMVETNRQKPSLSGQFLRPPAP